MVVMFNRAENKTEMETGKKKVYISGKIAHMDLDERREAFNMAAKYWSLHGYDVFNPFENGLSQEADWHEHMRIDIHALTECDIIYMLRGWEQSKGAKLELDVASSCGLTVWFETNNRE